MPKKLVTVEHDSQKANTALTELEHGLRINPQRLETLRKGFKGFEDFFVYKRSSALRAGHCTAGFQPTRKFLKFVSALRADKRNGDSVHDSTLYNGTGSVNTESLPFQCGKLISLWDMKDYPTDKIIHALKRIDYVIEIAAPYKSKTWPPKECDRIQKMLKGETISLLDELSLVTAKNFCVQLATDLPNLGIESIIAKADCLRGVMESELKGRKFFVLNPDNVQYYNNSLLAGEQFKDNWPRANSELIEAGSCFSLGRHTACVCHLMRALEYALKSFESALVIPSLPPGPNNTWGAIIGRIEERKGRKGYKPAKGPAVPPAPPSPEWAANADFYDSCLSFFSATKSACRDKAFHVESSYDEDGARKMFDCTVAVLSKIAENLSEIK